MVHEDSSYGKKLKPRGKPFPKGNRRGSLEENLLASTRHKDGDVGSDVEIDEVNTNTTNTNNEFNDSKDSINNDSSHSFKEEEELVDSIEFKNGENKLTIKFIKKSNRMFRLQVYLNDKIEVRPVTYTGSSTGYSFWNLLKGSLK